MNSFDWDIMQEIILGSLGIGISFFVVYIIFKIAQLKSKERLAMIEKGMAPSQADATPKKRNDNSLKNGLLMVGIAVGLMAGYILDEILDIATFPAYASMILIFGGGMLLYYHKMISKKEAEQKADID